MKSFLACFLATGCALSPARSTMATRQVDLRPRTFSPVSAPDDDPGPPPPVADSPPPVDISPPAPPPPDDNAPRTVVTPDGDVRLAQPIGGDLYQPLDGSAPTPGTPL